MIKAVTGTKDILPSDLPAWKILQRNAENIFSYFNYKEIRTPVFEETFLFARSIGEETDIVGKEMYSFFDRSGSSLTLKPEMTASVCRAFIEHSLGKQQQLNKFYYISPMFRQERPQAGRLRQFHQFGAEAIGSSSMLLDAEIIQVSFEILKSLGLADLSLKLNTLGMPGPREKYKKVLREFLEDKKNDLTEESRKRLDKNILRVFDSKAENDKEIMKKAPLLTDYIDDESRDDFEEVKSLLSSSGLRFEVDPMLVRGLDYYTKTTFEIISGKVGSQNALCGGGRYDFLIEQLGGDPAPAVGFAAGMERILLACEKENSIKIPEEEIDLYIIRIDADLSRKVFEIAQKFRKKNISAEIDYLNRSVKAQMREANKLKSRFVLFVGGDEYKSGSYLLKNMKNGEQRTLSFEKAETELPLLLAQQNR